VLAHAGAVPEQASHLLPELADFCLALEDATIAVATGFISDELVVTLRYGGKGQVDVGEIARRLAEGGGRGGGHAAMARATLPQSVVREKFGPVKDEDLRVRLLSYIKELAKTPGAEATLTRR